MELSSQLRFSLDLLLEDLEHYNAHLKKADAALKALAATERHRQSCEALRIVVGVGPVTAMAIRTELIAPERFDDGRQVASMAGLAPLISRTGQTVHEGPLMKCGKPVPNCSSRWSAAPTSAPA